MRHSHRRKRGTCWTTASWSRAAPAGASPSPPPLPSPMDSPSVSVSGLHTTAGGPQPGVCLSLSPCSARWPLTPCRGGSPQASPELGRPLLPGLRGFTKCPGFVLILLVALRVAGRLDKYLRPAILGRQLPKPGRCPRGAPSLGSHSPRTEGRGGGAAQGRQRGGHRALTVPLSSH